jgi:hypothetical protein
MLRNIAKAITSAIEDYTDYTGVVAADEVSLCLFFC